MFTLISVVPPVCGDVIARQPAGGTTVVKVTACRMQQRLNVVGGGVIQRRSIETVRSRQTRVIPQ